MVLPATGTVRVVVKDGAGTPISGAFVTLSSSAGGSASVFTDADGGKTIGHVGLGDIYVTASANGFVSTASGKLDSQSTTLTIPVTLSGQRIGDYRFDGIPASNNSATIRFYGPDGLTLGASVTVPLPAGPLVNNVTLDGTPPQVTATSPANNANSVAPNAHIFVTFSEPLRFVDAGHFQLLAGDDGSQVSIAARNTTNAKGEYQAEITPGAQLRSNTIYVFKVLRGLQDLTGNDIKGDITITFRTVDYTEPKIIHVLPPVTQPVDQGVVFQFQFNKSVTLDSFANGGFVKMETLSGPGGSVTGTIQLSVPRFGQTISGSEDPTTIAVAPMGTAVEKGKFYRLTMGGIRDTATPFNTQKDPQSFEWHSVDDIKPVVTIKSPVAPGLPLVVNGDYVIGVALTDEGTTNPSSDVQWVDWFSSDGTTDTVLVRTGKAPYSYTLHVVPGTTTRDRSGSVSFA